MSEDIKKAMTQEVPVDTDGVDPDAVPADDIKEMLEQADQMEDEPEEKPVETPAVEENLEIPEFKAEPETKEELEAIGVPAYIKDIDFSKEQVELDGVQIDGELLMQAVEKWEGLESEGWTHKRLDQMEPEQQKAYKAVQILQAKQRAGKEPHLPDRFRNEVRNMDSNQPTEADWAMYEKLKQDAGGKKLLDALSNLGNQLEPVAPEPTKEEYNEFAEGLATSFAEGEISKEELTGKITNLAKGIQSDVMATMESKLDQLVAQKVDGTLQAKELKKRETIIVEEHEKLMGTGDARYEDWATSKGVDGYSAVGRLVAFGNPLTGETMTPDSAFEYLLTTSQKGKKGRINWDVAGAQPRGAAVSRPESTLTKTMMEDMTETEAMLKLLELEEQGR